MTTESEKELSWDEWMNQNSNAAEIDGDLREVVTLSDLKDRLASLPKAVPVSELEELMDYWQKREDIAPSAARRQLIEAVRDCIHYHGAA